MKVIIRKVVCLRSRCRSASIVAGVFRTGSELDAICIRDIADHTRQSNHLRDMGSPKHLLTCSANEVWLRS